MKIKHNVLSAGVVFKDENAYVSFPHLVRSGDIILLAFRKAGVFSKNAALNNVATHHDPDSSIMLVKSHDQGLTWSSPLELYKGPYGVNDPALTVTSQGKVLCRFVALDIRKRDQYSGCGKVNIFSHRSEHGLVSTVVGNFVFEAESGNLDQWTYIGCTDCDAIGPSCSRDPIVELQDGSLIMPVYTGAPQRSDMSWCLRSFDGGKHWGNPTLIAEDPLGATSQMRGINFNETSIVDFGNGELVAMVRGDSTFHTDSGFMAVGGVGKLYCVHSHDGGMSWGHAMDTETFGQPGALLGIGGDKLMCTYGVRKNPYGVRVKISNDRGRTWPSDEIMLVSDSPIWDCGYPASLQIDKSTFLTTYYMPDSNGIRHLRYMKWEIDA